jgi:hypothetical protein
VNFRRVVVRRFSFWGRPRARPWTTSIPRMFFPHNVCICDWGVGTGRARGRPGFKIESQENEKEESGDEERRGMVRDRKGKENHHRLKDAEAGMTTTMDDVSEMRNWIKRTLTSKLG